MHDLFGTNAHGMKSLPLLVEQDLIRKAQAGDGDAMWALLVQYRGLLRKSAHAVRSQVRGMTDEQIEDLQQDLVLTAVEVIKTFDLEKYTRLSQVLPGPLRQTATKVATAIDIPRKTMARWFHIWRAADQDFDAAAKLAPSMDMSTNTFRAIQHALEHAETEWSQIAYSAGRATADIETYKLAHMALDVLPPGEREVIELFYGFRGEPKTDQEVAFIREVSPRTIKEQRLRALDRMRNALTAGQAD